MTPPYGSIIQGLESAYDIGTGIYQNSEANKLKKGLIRPTYTPPSAATMALENAKIMALKQQFPGQSAVENRINASTSGALRMAQEGAGSSNELLAAASGINGNAQNANVDLGIRAADFQQQNQQNLNSALMSYAGYQDKAFDYNQNQPYEQKADAIRALKQAGQTNIKTGLGGLGTSAYSATRGNGSPDSGTDNNQALMEMLKTYFTK